MCQMELVLLLSYWLVSIKILCADNRISTYNKIEDCVQGSKLTTTVVPYGGQCTLACSSRMDCGAYRLDRHKQYCDLLCLGGQCDSSEKLETVCTPQGGSAYQKLLCTIQVVAYSSNDTAGVFANKGTTVTYTCLSGYQFPDTSTTKQSRCTGLEQWTLDVPACELMTCTVQSVSNSANDAGAATVNYGTTVTHTCNSGHEFSDQSTSKQTQCNGMEQWSATVPSSCESTVSSGSSWQQTDGGLRWISSGQAGAWGVNSNNNNYYRTGTYRSSGSSPTTGSSWDHFGDGMKQMSVGYDVVWAVNTGDSIFWRTGISSSNPTGTGWTQVGGGLSRISVASKLNNMVWGVNSGQSIYRRLGITSSNYGGTGWKHIDGLSAKDISIDYSGVWAITSSDQIYYRTGTYGVADTDGSGWENVSGGLKQISSGYNIVWAVNSNNCAYYRSGQSASNPKGDSWVQTDCGTAQVSVSGYGGSTWSTNSGSGIFYRVGTSFAE